MPFAPAYFVHSGHRTQQVFDQMPKHIFFNVFVIYFEENTLNSDDEYFYAMFMDSSSSDDDEQDEDETLIMVAVHEEMRRTEEHVLNFKGSTPGYRVLNRRRGLGAS